MAPEQAAGKKGHVSRRTDVYRLGAILYHLLTARPPFQAESLPETLQQVAGADPVPPRLHSPGDSIIQLDPLELGMSRLSEPECDNLCPSPRSVRIPFDASPLLSYRP